MKLSTIVFYRLPHNSAITSYLCMSSCMNINGRINIINDNDKNGTKFFHPAMINQIQPARPLPFYMLPPHLRPIIHMIMIPVLYMYIPYMTTVTYL